MPTLKALACALLVLVAAPPTLVSEIARPGYEFSFPRDHFEHPAFPMEWWYYTGNVADESGRRFGYELTFFRAALGAESSTDSDWALDQIYVAHFVVTDVRAQRLIHRERANRRGPGLAGASAETGTIWNGNWSVEYDLDDPDTPTQKLRAWDESVSLELLLEPAKPYVIHGEDGISRKGPGEGQASHYVSFTRLLATGRLTIDGSVYQVQGLSWMDHEFFGESMAGGLAGWDWFSVQLEDGTELMIAGIRLPDGRYSPYSHGTLVHADGSTTGLHAGDIRLTPGRTWQSDETGGEYPVEWTIAVPSIRLELEVRPLRNAQEIVSYVARMPTYWEGPVLYTGERAGAPVAGKGYLEMTGYDGQLALTVD